MLLKREWTNLSSHFLPSCESESLTEIFYLLTLTWTGHCSFIKEDFNSSIRVIFFIMTFICLPPFYMNTNSISGNYTSSDRSVVFFYVDCNYVGVGLQHLDLKTDASLVKWRLSDSLELHQAGRLNSKEKDKMIQNNFSMSESVI